MRRVRLALAALPLLFGATGCTAFEAIVDTEQALWDAGFADAGVSWASENGVDSVEVYWTAQAQTSEALEDESRAAAGVVWRVAPVRFDLVRTDPYVSFAEDAFDPVRTFGRGELEQEFGPRPAGLDRSVGDLLHVGHYLRWALGGLVAFLASSVLIVVLVLRASRRRRDAAA